MDIKKYKNNIIISRFIKVFSVDGLVKASSIILIPVYLKLMTQSEYGLFNYLVSLIATFSLVLNFGLYVAQSKLYHNYKDDEERGSFLFTLNFTLFTFLFSFLLVIYLLRLDYQAISLLFKNQINYESYRNSIFLAIVVSICSLMLFNYFMTSEKINLVQKYGLSRLIFVNLIVIFLLYEMKGDTVTIRLKYTYLVEFILVLIFSYSYFKSMNIKFNLIYAVKSMKLGLPIMASAIFGIIINFGDKFFLEKYGSFTDLSIYYLAFSISAIIPTMFMTVQNIWLPLFLKENDINANIIKTKKMIIHVIGFFIIISLLTMPGVKLLLFFNIISSKYNSIMLVLPILLLAQIVNSITPLYSNYLIYFEKTYIVPIAGLLVGVGSILLNISLIPRFNIYGAAVSSFFANLIYFLTYYKVVSVYTKRSGYEN